MRTSSLVLALILSILIVVPASANSVGSSTMEFEGTLTDAGSGVYTGTIDAVAGAWYAVGGGGELISTSGGFDVYAEEGGCALVEGYYGTGAWNCSGLGTYTVGYSTYDDHDAYPDDFGAPPPWGNFWNPDVPDYNNYELVLTGSTWALQYKSEHQGTPMSGIMDWTNMYASENDVGQYTGTIPSDPDANDGGGAAHGAGAGWWDMDWTWGTDAIPLELAGFEVTIDDLGGGVYHVTLTPADPEEVWVDDDYTSATPGWGVTHFATVQDGIDAVSGSIVNIAAGTYPGAISVPASTPITLSGAGMTQTFLTGGMVLSDGVDGVTLEHFAISGEGAASAIIRAGHPNNDFTMDHVLLDGEGATYAGRSSYAGGRMTGDVTVTNCEFKNVSGWSLFDSASTGWETVMGTVTFAHNYIHECDGAVAFRGDNTDRIDHVIVYDNVWENINDNWNAPGTVENAWACFEVHGVESLEFYGNTMTNVKESRWSEGQGLQTWRVDDVDVYANIFDNCWQGIWLPGLGVEPAPTGSIHGNSFTNITDLSLFTTHGGGEFTSGTLDASGNWWGDLDPTDDISGTIDYTPWLASGVDTSGDAGFQGDLSELWVDSYSPQAGSVDILQEGIELVSGSIVNLRNGVYTGASTVTDKNLTLIGESETGTIVEAATSQTGSVNTFTVNAAGKTVSFNYLTIRHGDYGVRSSAGNVDVLHCTFYHNGWDGTGVPATPTQAGMATFFSTYATNGGALRIENSAGSEIAHCTLYENDRGIRYQDGADGDIHDNVVYDNIESGVYLAASTYDGGSGCSDTDVYDNECYENMEHGLLCIGGIGNTFTDNTIYDNWNSGVTMWHVADVMISGNTFSGNNIYGFNGAGNASDGLAAVTAVGPTWNTGGTYVFKLVGNGIADNLTGSGATPTAVQVGTTSQPLPAAPIEVKNNVFTGHDIDIHVTSQAAFADVDYNAFSGTSYGVYNEDTSKALLDAELNWWGAGDGPSGEGPGSGVPVSTDVDFDPWIGKAGSENVVFDPELIELNEADQDGTTAVKYLGGASDLLYGFSITFTWDPAKVSMDGVSMGDIFPGVLWTDYTFLHYGGAGTHTIDCTRLGAATGVGGPGTLFTVDFSAVGCGSDDIAITSILFRDNGNYPLSGVYARNGAIEVDTEIPAVAILTVDNLTNLYFDDYAKDLDDIVIEATITDACGDVDDVTVEANLSTLLDGGGTAVAPSTYATGTATWNLDDVDLTADGDKIITVTVTDLLGNTSFDQITVRVDNKLPEAVAGLVAAPGHNKSELTWTDTPATYDDNFHEYVVRSHAWGDLAYPTYPVAGTPIYPANAADGDLVDEHVTGGAYTATYASDSSERSILYYGLFVRDKAGNYGPAGTGDRCTNYWLGDVARSNNSWNPDGNVFDADIVKLGGTYGGVPSGDFLKCDVGPTDDHSRLGIPQPAGFVNFEDLMIFAMNYDVVAPRIVPFLAEPSVGDLALALNEANRSSDGVLTLALRLEGNLGEVKGLSTELEFDGLEFLSAGLSDEMSAPVADVFFWSDAASRSAQIDLAVLGTDVTIGGSGDVAVLTFRIVDEAYTVDFASATLRGAANDELTADLEGLSYDGVPASFKLVRNTPNPFNPVTTVGYHLPSESRVTIRVFDVTGRVVTTLVDGVVEPGRHTVVWNGTNEHGESVGSGVYFCTMETPEYRGSHKMMLLK